MLEQLRWIKEYTKRLAEKPPVVIAKTTTPLPALGEYVIPAFDVNKYNYLLIYSLPSHAGEIYIDYLNSEEVMLKQIHLQNVAGLWIFYTTKTAGVKARIKYKNGTTAQTSFIFVVDGVRK